jgi:tetratricopeptide (TPR) repeat protein
MKYCPECGYKLDKGTEKYRPECGEKLEGRAPAPGMNAPAPRTYDNAPFFNRIEGLMVTTNPVLHDVKSEGLTEMVLKAVTHFHKQEYDETIRYCDELITIDPNDSLGWNYKGRALAELGRYHDALTCFDKAIEIDPNSANTWTYKGIALTKLGSYDEAKRQFDRVLKINPNDANTWYYRACCNIREAEIDSGLGDLRRAIGIDKQCIEYAKQEECFESVRNDERFKVLIAG